MATQPRLIYLHLPDCHGGESVIFRGVPGSRLWLLDEAAYLRRQQGLRLRVRPAHLITAEVCLRVPRAGCWHALLEARHPDAAIERRPGEAVPT